MRISVVLGVMGAVVTSGFLAAPATAQSPPPTMKAIVIHSYGGPDVLKYEDVPRPQPKQDEILIRVMAAGVNPVDTYIRQGYVGKMIGKQFPLILGMFVRFVLDGSSICRT